MYVNTAYNFLALRSKKIPKPLIKIIMRPVETIFLSEIISFLNEDDEIPNGRKFLIVSYSYSNQLDNTWISNRRLCGVDTHSTYIFTDEKLFSKKFIVNYLNIVLYKNYGDIEFFKLPCISRFAQKKFNKICQERGVRLMYKYIKKSVHVKKLQQEILELNF